MISDKFRKLLKGFIFGPIPSRRLGLSLGVSPIPPKTCNYNCVYCQLGSTLRLTNTREEFYPVKDILDELNYVLDSLGPEVNAIDAITVVPEGEPLLYLKLGELLEGMRTILERRALKAKLAVITNGALLYDPEVRMELITADIVLPSLDTADEKIFRKLNRPHPEILLKNVIKGLREFRKVFRGQIWLEVMLVRGYNDQVEQIEELARTVNDIGPDMVTINVPSRPPSMTGVTAPDAQILDYAREMLAPSSGSRTRSKLIRGTIGEAEPISGSLVRFYGLRDTILNAIKRHPMSIDELSLITGTPVTQLEEVLNQLVEEDLVIPVDYGKRRFFRYKGIATHLP